jgi:hypothetical protein
MHQQGSTLGLPPCSSSNSHLKAVLVLSQLPQDSTAVGPLLGSVLLKLKAARLLPNLQVVLDSLQLKVSLGPTSHHQLLRKVCLVPPKKAHPLAPTQPTKQPVSEQPLLNLRLEYLSPPTNPQLVASPLGQNSRRNNSQLSPVEGSVSVPASRLLLQRASGTRVGWASKQPKATKATLRLLVEARLVAHLNLEGLLVGERLSG